MAGYRLPYSGQYVNRHHDMDVSDSDVESNSSDNELPPAETQNHGYIKCSQSPDSEAPKTVKRCELMIPCPARGCKGEKISWKCSKCDTFVEYGLTDGFFFCDCGKFVVNGCQYKCSQHDFSAADSSQLKSSLGKLVPPRDFNLLILGETGVGKSTFINAFTNYLTYATLDDALEGDLITPIPNKFTIADDNMKIVSIKNGEETAEEDFGAGKSATQSTKVHKFTFENTALRIIDTPGVGDVRGTEQDDKNVQDILNTIASLDELHAIIVLLKPNLSRLSLSFRYCIEKIFTHLHKSATDNIVFGFTNTRGTNFRPGETLPVLLEYLRTASVRIRCEKDNAFCFDSEGYRFLAANKHGIQFDHDLFDSYSKSWDYSVTEIQRMLAYITQLKPHVTKETLSLNNARLLILQLTKPMAEITKNIALNLELLDKEEERIRNLTEDTENMEKDLMVDKIDLKAEQLNFPRTVCTNSACVKVTGVEGRHNINYITWCHDHCYLTGVPVETTNNAQLMDCAAMGGTSTCQVCGHNYGEHMHITYELIESIVKVENESIRKMIDNGASLKDAKDAAIQDLKKTVDELTNERMMIEKSAAKFGAFLEHNAITAYSDARLEYLKFLINEEKKKKPEFRDEKLLTTLEESLRIYSEEVALIKKTIKSGKGSKLLNIAEIDDSIKKLFSLKHSGQMLQQIKSVAHKASGNSYREANHKFVHIKSNSGIHSVLSSLWGKVKGGVGGWTSKKKVSPEKSPVQRQPVELNRPKGRSASRHTDDHQTFRNGRGAEQRPQRNGKQLDDCIESNFFNASKGAERASQSVRPPSNRPGTQSSTAGKGLLQEEDESVDEYIRRCLSMMKNNSSEDRINAIIDGLKLELYATVTDEHRTSIHSLIKHLKAVEETESHLSSGNKTVSQGVKNWEKENLAPVQKSQPKQQAARKISSSESIVSRKEHDVDRERANEGVSEGTVTQAEGEKVSEYIKRCLISFKPGLTQQDQVDLIVSGLQPRFRLVAYDEDFKRVFDLKEHLVRNEMDDLDQ